jgi:hypothetical protein
MTITMNSMATFECWAGIQPRFGSFPINISFLGDIYHTNFVKIVKQKAATLLRII